MTTDEASVEKRKCARCGGHVAGAERFCHACEEHEAAANTARLLADAVQDLARRYVIFGGILLVVGAIVVVVMTWNHAGDASERALAFSPFGALALWEIGWGLALTKTERHRKLCAFLPYPPLGIFTMLVRLMDRRERARAQWLRDATDIPRSMIYSPLGEDDFFTNAATALEQVYRLDDRAARTRHGGH